MYFMKHVLYETQQETWWLTKQTHPQPSAPKMGMIGELVVRYHELKCKYTLSMGL